MKSLAIILLILLPVLTLFCQNDRAAVTKNEQAEVLKSLAKQLNDNYVFPDTGEEMSKLLLSKLQSGHYANIQNPVQFAEQLTNDLRQVSNDRHLQVLFAPDRIKAMQKSTSWEERQAFSEREMEERRRSNFGFKEVKLLKGNIGYIDLRNFIHTEFARETAIEAMNFVSNADALIIDLRQNGGGSPSMIQLITSYLYGNKPVLLNNFYFRPTDTYTQTWTLSDVPGKRRPDIDVYVLTSNFTFSAAEEFSYNLKNLERATLIGETTGGGAHPVSLRVASDRFLISLPIGRAINPITNTNWEGTGVEPHIKVEASQALKTAHLKALEVLAINNSPDNFHEWLLQGLKAEYFPVSIPDNTLSSYAGQYGARKIIYENGTLYYEREGQDRFPMIPMDVNLFALENIPYLRLKIIQENDMIVGVKGLHEDGRQTFTARDWIWSL